MKQYTTWRPDTCDCELTYEWDDSLPLNKRTHAIHTINKSCLAHSALSVKTEHYDKVIEENKRKNILYGKILDNIPSAVNEKVNDDGTITKTLKLNKEYKWSFDNDRVLVVELIGFTNAEKNIIKALVDSPNIRIT